MGCAPPRPKSLEQVCMGLNSFSGWSALGYCVRHTAAPHLILVQMVTSGNSDSIRMAEFDQKQFLLTDLEPELELNFFLLWTGSGLSFSIYI